MFVLKTILLHGSNSSHVRLNVNFNTFTLHANLENMSFVGLLKSYSCVNNLPRGFGNKAFYVY